MKDNNFEHHHNKIRDSDSEAKGPRASVTRWPETVFGETDWYNLQKYRTGQTRDERARSEAILETRFFETLDSEFLS